MEAFLIINLTSACCRSCCAKDQTDHSAALWLISIPPFITFITTVMKHCARLHEALTGLCLFNTTCTDLIYPWVSFHSSAPYMNFGTGWCYCHKIDFHLGEWIQENLLPEQPTVHDSIDLQLNYSSSISKLGLNMSLLNLYPLFPSINF